LRESNLQSNKMSISTKTDLHCYHCGEPCRTTKIVHDERNFCCDGCLAVNQILETNGLTNYYDLERFPGIKRKSQKVNHYDFLENEDIANKLLEFQDDTYAKYTFTLPEIHCSSCVWLLENLNKLHGGVKNVRVQFIKKEATVVFEKSVITFKELAELLDEIGYAPTLSLQNLEGKSKVKTKNKLIKRLAVAGFCFGNIMLFSFPEYFGMSVKEDFYFVKLFGGMNLALATIALIYSGDYYLKSAYKSLKKKILHINVPLAIGMLTLFLRTVYEILAGAGPGYADSLAGLIFFLLIGKWFQDLTYGNLSFERDYKSYFPIAVRVRTDEGIINKPLDKVVVGDRLQVRNEEIIPVDGILLNGLAAIDYGFVTGESVPVSKDLGELLYAGGKQMGGGIELEATKEVSQSQLTKIWNEISSTSEPTRTKAFSDRIAKYFTISLIAVAVFTLGFWMIVDSSVAIFAFTSVLIVACPCALALSAPFATGNAMRLLGRKKYYLKNAGVVESLSQISHMVFDKTGTITDVDHYDVEYEGAKLSFSEKEEIKGLVSQSKHPYSEAIYKSLADINSAKVEHFKEVVGKGIEGYVNEKFYRIGSARWLKSDPNSNQSSVCIELNGTFLGSFSIHNKFRPELKNIFNRLKNDRYKLSLLSGDHYGDKYKLEKIFDKFYFQLFKQSPSNKLERIKELQTEGQKVMMIGDGLNDAGALLKSDVGVVITNDSNNFTPAAKVIVDQKAFELLPMVMKYSQSVMKLIKFSFLLSLIYNIAGLFFAVQGLLSPIIAAILMPLSSITVVVFNTIGTRVAANRLLNTRQQNNK
jgi:P-type Cu+ transporter